MRGKKMEKNTQVKKLDKVLQSEFQSNRIHSLKTVGAKLFNGLDAVQGRFNCHSRVLRILNK